MQLLLRIESNASWPGPNMINNFWHRDVFSTDTFLMGHFFDGTFFRRDNFSTDTFLMGCFQPDIFSTDTFSTDFFQWDIFSTEHIINGTYF